MFVVAVLEYPLSHEVKNCLCDIRMWQILSGRFLDSYGKDIINIHHGLLPSFKGGNPSKQVFNLWLSCLVVCIFCNCMSHLTLFHGYQAYDSGVKLIGATSHFVTEGLDAGPIIEQMVKSFCIIITHTTSFSLTNF